MNRFAFSTLDFGFLCDDDCDNEAIKIAVTRITNLCSVEIEQNGNWCSPTVTFTLDFVDRAFYAANNLLSGAAVCDVVPRMAASPYLFFPPNSNVLSEFCLRVVPRIQHMASAAELELITSALQPLRTRQAERTSQQRLETEELLAALSYAITTELPSESGDNSWTTTTEQDPPLFASELDWSTRAANSLIEGLRAHENWCLAIDSSCYIRRHRGYG